VYQEEAQAEEEDHEDPRDLGHECVLALSLFALCALC
jgi:hypothetical protein